MLTEIMQYADPENYPSALNVPRNAAAPSPDISRTLPPTIGAEVPAAGSTTDDSSEIEPPIGTSIARRSRGSRAERASSLAAPVGIPPYSSIQWLALRP
jgi:hypothetical protein